MRNIHKYANILDFGLVYEFIGWINHTNIISVNLFVTLTQYNYSTDYHETSYTYSKIH